MTSTWSRLLFQSDFPLIVVASLLGILISGMFPPLRELVDPPQLLFPVFAIFIFFALKKSHLAFQSPLYGYYAVQLLYLWFAIDFLVPGNFTPHMLAVGAATLSGGYYLLKDFGYFWRFPFFRTQTLFFVVSVISLILWGSNFKVGALVGYPGLARMTESGDTAAKMVVFLGSYIAFLSMVCGLAVFKDVPNPAALLKQLYSLNKVFIGAIAFFCMVAYLKLKENILPGQMGIVVMIYFTCFTILFAQKSMLFQKLPNFYQKLTPMIVVLIPLLSLVLVIDMNKTGLLGVVISFGALIILSTRLVPWLNYPQTLARITKPLEVKVLLLIVSMLGLMVFMLAGGLDLVSEKIDYFANGFSKLSTLKVRTSNWHFFFQDWFSTLDWFKTLFGYGLGKSRETIFYISVTRLHHENNMVQTLHNSYLEHFYDYGLSCLLMYGTSLLILIDNVKKVFNPKLNQTLKLYCILSLCVMLFVGFYGLADGVRIQILMVYYALLGLIEGLKAAWFRLDMPPED